MVKRGRIEVDTLSFNAELPLKAFENLNLITLSAPLVMKWTRCQRLVTVSSDRLPRFTEKEPRGGKCGPEESVTYSIITNTSRMHTSVSPSSVTLSFTHCMCVCVYSWTWLGQSLHIYSPPDIDLVSTHRLHLLSLNALTVNQSLLASLQHYLREVSNEEHVCILGRKAALWDSFIWVCLRRENTETVIATCVQLFSK